MGKTFKSMILTGTQDARRRENQPASSNSDQKEGKKPIEIDSRLSIYSVAFLADGKYVVSSGEEGKIRHWRVEDGRAAGDANGCGRCSFQHRSATR